MSTSPQPSDRWALQRVAGERSYRWRWTLLATSVFAAAAALFNWLDITDHGWARLAVMTVFYAVIMHFIAGALWRKNEADYLKRAGGA